MKGLVLAGGTGSRLMPLTLGVSKQLLPVYDKPLIHYPISTLMLAGIREIMIITTPRDRESFERTLGNGSRYGISIEYAVQENPDGIAQAFIIGESFIGKDSCALALGDNIIYGSGLGRQLSTFSEIDGAQIFAYKVKDPSRYGVVEFNKFGQVINLEEKPLNPKSSFAVIGLYFYDNTVVDLAKTIKPSQRGELEITSINQSFLKEEKLKVSVLERGTAWLDTGTFESLSAASNFIQIVEERQGQKISCLEEIAWRNGWLDDSQLLSLSESYGQSPFGGYLRGLIT
jgi:glucose-1-phosphate thymidylyltransferase